MEAAVGWGLALGFGETVGKVQEGKRSSRI
jgi:hypothetical protein